MFYRRENEQARIFEDDGSLCCKIEGIDANIYSVACQSIMYEHTSGIVLSINDANQIGILEEHNVMHGTNAYKMINDNRELFRPKMGHHNDYIGIDNCIIHDVLNDAAVSVCEIAGQETWVFGDASYVTRSADADSYWIGLDVDYLGD